MVKPHHPFRTSITIVMSRQWQVLERSTVTHVMSSCTKARPLSRPLLRTSRDTSVNWSKCTRSQRESLSNSHNQQCFSPALKISKFQSSTMPRPTCRKTTKTMAPCRRSTSKHLRRTHPWKTHRWPQPFLLHAHASRPATPPFKRKRETSQTSASSAPTT